MKKKYFSEKKVLFPLFLHSAIGKNFQKTLILANFKAKYSTASVNCTFFGFFSPALWDIPFWFIFSRRTIFTWIYLAKIRKKWGFLESGNVEHLHPGTLWKLQREEICQQNKNLWERYEMSPKFQELNLPISLKFLANTAVFLPLFGFGFCLIWSFWFDYETSTQTHCEVDNFAPSISAAIGNYLPQKYVWQTCISLHITPRFLFLYLYKQFYETRLANPIGKFLFCCQNTCLCDVTLISRIFFLFLLFL